jgi:hypothetical protein
VTESADESTEIDEDAADLEDVDAAMDVGAPDQDTAVAEYLEDHPEDYRIEEIEDHGALGIDAEVDREVPEPDPDTGEDAPPKAGREELSRLLDAERYAERVDRRLEG